MTCEECMQIVHDSLTKVAGVKNVSVDLYTEQAHIETDQPVPQEVLQAALAGTHYQLSETASDQKKEHDQIAAKEAWEKKKALLADLYNSCWPKRL